MVVDWLSFSPVQTCKLTHCLSNETRDSVKNMNRIRYGILLRLYFRSIQYCQREQLSTLRTEPLHLVGRDLVDFALRKCRKWHHAGTCKNVLAMAGGVAFLEDVGEDGVPSSDEYVVARIVLIPR